jgi:hypothetical protein
MIKTKNLISVTLSLWILFPPLLYANSASVTYTDNYIYFFQQNKKTSASITLLKEIKENVISIRDDIKKVINEVKKKQ